MHEQEDHEFLPPAPTDAPPQQAIVADATLGPIALLANILITTIIIVAMLVDGTQARTAIIVGGIYFGVSGFVFAIVTTGTLTAIVNAYQAQRTERQRIAAYLALGTMALQWRYIEAEAAQTPRTPPTHSVERLSPLTTFVAPYADEQKAALEAIAWAEKLYGRDGAPDSRKVLQDGRLKIRVIGSKRGGGSKEAGRWLLQQGVIVRVAGGYALRLSAFPHRRYVSALLRA